MLGGVGVMLKSEFTVTEAATDLVVSAAYAGSGYMQNREKRHPIKKTENLLIPSIT
jgi:ABC-type molybdenum transport system ATPase subunit/photorepair protein PhrA